MGQSGLPALIGDYRDSPEVWRQGDFPMDESRLRSRLSQRTVLILGNVRDTVDSFFDRYSPPPIGFISVDLDLYSSAKEALRILTLPTTRMLWHVPMYFDDITGIAVHRFAGELLAIQEFNDTNTAVKIDRWHGLGGGRPFPDQGYLGNIYIAHDLASISRARADRLPGLIRLSNPKRNA